MSRTKLSPSLATPRNSSVEILRLISMFFVLILHFNHWGINIDILSMSGPLTKENFVGHIIESIAIVAVNVFVLISGYFGISFKIRRLFNLYLVCFIWGLFSYLLYCLLGNHEIGKPIFAWIFAFTHNKWWFIIDYLYLYLCAPLLNFATRNVTRKQLLVVIILYSFSTLYIGYIRNMGDNQIGMSFAQFVYLYLIGRYIHSLPKEFFHTKRKLFALIGLMFTSITFALAILNQLYFHLHVNFLRPYLYNSPWVIGAAICMLCLALSFSFHSKAINRISGSALSAYLLQDSSYFGYKWLYPMVGSFLASFSIAQKYLLMLAISIVFLFACIMTDQLFRIAFYKPIMRVFDKRLTLWDTKLEKLLK